MPIEGLTGAFCGGVVYTGVDKIKGTSKGEECLLTLHLKPQGPAALEAQKLGR